VCLSSSFINSMISFLLLVFFFPTIYLLYFVLCHHNPFLYSFFSISFLSFPIFFICNFYGSSLTSGCFPHTLLKLLFIFPDFFIQVNYSLFRPSQHLSMFPSVLALCLHLFFVSLPWRISLSTTLFSHSYVTVACDSYNIIKLCTKLTCPLIVSCITY